MIRVEQVDQVKLEEIKQWETWVKEPSIFDYDQSKKESFYILEGKAVLTTEDNKITEISPGDFVTVESGQLVNWKISEQIKKHYTFFE